MKLKNVLVGFLAGAIAVSALTFASAAENGGTVVKALRVAQDRGGDFDGICIDLAKFIESVENADQGFYQFDFTILPDPGLGGAIKPAIKFLTEAGDDGSPANVRFTIRPEIEEITRYITLATVAGDPAPEEMDLSVGDIPAELIYNSGLGNKELRIQTQGTIQAGFTVMNLIARHEVDGVVTEVYNMSKDPYVQSGTVDKEIWVEEGDSWGFLRKCGSPVVYVTEVDLADIPETAIGNIEPWAVDVEYVADPDFVPPVEEEPEEEETQAPADDAADDAAETTAAGDAAETTTAADGAAETTTAAASTDGGGNTGLVIGIIVGAVVIITIIVIVIKKKS